MSVYGVPGTKYINKHRDGYVISRREGGRMKYYGYARTLIIALMRRDWIIANGWRKYDVMKPGTHIVDKYNGTFTIKKCEKSGDEMVCEYYGTYNSLEDAQEERDRLVELGWDLDAWCELVDERNDDGDIIWLNRRVY